MPAWGELTGGLRPEEIGKAVKHLRELSGVTPEPEKTPPRWLAADGTVGQRLFASSCAGCHGRKGEGGEGPALNNKVLLANATDSFLVETIARGRRGTPMPAFGEPSAVYPFYSRVEVEAIATYIRSWAGNKR